jgi:glycosyltransferase involved in cell wall biosynthesis
MIKDIMEPHPMVSVLVITYNHEQYIRQALDGILMQKVGFSYEIIIHDDASSDNTQKIIREYEIQYPELIKAIYQKENQYSKGISIQTFFLKYLKGKYIANCEGDDYWTDPYKLVKQVNFLESNPDYIATAHNVRTINEYGELVDDSLNPYKIYSSHIYTLKDAERIRLPGQTASLVYRNIWLNTSNEIIELYRSCRINGDQKLSIFLALQGDIYCFDDIMADHRKVIFTGDSWSAKNYKKNLTLYLYNGILDVNRFAKNTYGVILDNKKIRLDVVYSAFCILIRYPTRDNLKILTEIIRISNEERIESMLYTFVKLSSWPIRKLQKSILKNCTAFYNEH